MIKYVTGDLIKAFLNGDVDCIAHQANCYNVMGSGFAKQLKKDIPEAFKADEEYLRLTGRDRLGHCSFFEKENNKFVFNIYGQLDYRRWHEDYGTQLSYLTVGLIRMANELDDKGLANTGYKVGFPLIGCGLAGGDWEEVEKNIKTIFENSYDVYIYRK